MLFGCWSACRELQARVAANTVWQAQVYSGGSVGGAALLNEGKADICVNWAGARKPYHYPRT